MELGREDIKQINDLMPHVSIALREAIKCANLGHELFTAAVLGATKWQLFYRLIDRSQCKKCNANDRAFHSNHNLHASESTFSHLMT